MKYGLYTLRREEDRATKKVTKRLHLQIGDDSASDLLDFRFNFLARMGEPAALIRLDDNKYLKTTPEFDDLLIQLNNEIQKNKETKNTILLV